MKKIIYYGAIAFFSTAFVACGGSEEADNEVVRAGEEDGDNDKDNDNPFQALADLAEDLDKMQNGDGEMRQALHFKQLNAFLPEEIEGYSLEKGPSGQSMSQMGLSFSASEAEYKNADGDWIKIALVDYTAASSLYTLATAMWGNMSFENENEKGGGIKIGDHGRGWEVFKKNTGDANVSLGVGGRILLNIEANNQENTDFVVGIAKSMDLDALASAEYEAAE